MTIRPSKPGDDGTLGGDNEEMIDRPRAEGVKMRNYWVTTAFAVLVWLVITVMNITNLVLLGKGQEA